MKLFLECKVWKYPRTDAPDVCPEVPDNIKISKLENSQIFDVEGASVKIVHTPGHTTDHVVLTMEEDGVLFSGDCILGKQFFLISSNRISINAKVGNLFAYSGR